MMTCAACARPIRCLRADRVNRIGGTAQLCHTLFRWIAAVSSQLRAMSRSAPMSIRAGRTSLLLHVGVVADGCGGTRLTGLVTAPDGRPRPRAPDHAERLRNLA